MLPMADPVTAWISAAASCVAAAVVVAPFVAASYKKTFA
jgi:hypothetical protein